MEIIVGDDIFAPDYSSEIVLPLFLAHDGEYFPDEQWTDFASVLNMWAYDLIKYERYQTSKFELYFMDGPYRLDIVKTGDQVAIHCVEAHSNVDRMTILCTYVELLKAVCEASYKVGKLLYMKGIYQGKYAPIYKQATITGNALKATIEGKGTGMEILRRQGEDTGRQGDGSSVLTKSE